MAQQRPILQYFTAVVAVMLFYCPANVSPKGQFTEPLNSGLQMAIPYDLANIFIRPIAGSVSTFLSISLWFILVFGVITSPFGYMFGVPSRKYVLGGPIDVSHAQTAPRSLPDNWLSFNEEKWLRSDLLNSTLFLLPDDREGSECNDLLVCYSHGFFKKMPAFVLKLYRFFSRRIVRGNLAIERAIKTGLEGPKACDLEFTQCQYSRFKLAVKVFRNILPWTNRL